MKLCKRVIRLGWYVHEEEAIKRFKKGMYVLCILSKQYSNGNLLVLRCKTQSIYIQLFISKKRDVRLSQNSKKEFKYVV